MAGKKQKTVDLIIIGAGPAGLTASIYASRYKLSNIVIGKVLGGTITLAHKVENFPGFVSISGVELAQKMREQVKSLGAEIIFENVGKITKRGEIFEVMLESSNRVLKGRSVIVATGTERRKLGVPGEKEYVGRGVSYCSTCDAPFFRDKVVALIGGSDAAVSGAIHVAGFTKKVYIIYRRDKLRAEPIWVEEALNNPKIEVIYNTNVVEILGDGSKVTAVKLDNPYRNSDRLPLDGVFIEIGGVPGSSLVVPLGVELVKGGFVKVNRTMATKVKGLFAAGDLTTESLIMQQAITACAQGAIAAASAFKYLKGQKAPQILGVKRD
jgi:thioredoxin reductase (NADPH)